MLRYVMTLIAVMYITVMTLASRGVILNPLKTVSAISDTIMIREAMIVTKFVVS